MMLAAAIILISTSTAAVALNQANGLTIPSAIGCSGGNPSGLAPILACSCLDPGCNIGGPCPTPTTCPTGQNGTCEMTLYHVFNDNSCIPSRYSGLDPWTEASTDPETFYPSETLNFTVASRGTAIFHSIFGWYNVTGSAPSADDLHVMFDCNAATGASIMFDIRHDPAWAGGRIGFFLITPESRTSHGTCQGNNCCATLDRFRAGTGYIYYSEMKYNSDFISTNPYIHLIIYQSHITDRKFYFAWEDTYNTSSTDFTDLVTAVEGMGTADPASGNGVFSLLPFLASKKKDGGCSTGVAGGGMTGGLILAVTAAALSRRRRRH